MIKEIVFGEEGRPSKYYEMFEKYEKMNLSINYYKIKMN